MSDTDKLEKGLELLDVIERAQWNGTAPIEEIQQLRGILFTMLHYPAASSGERLRDSERLDWLERNSAEVGVFDPPSGDAWVWSVFATDDDNCPIGEGGHSSVLREAIDAAMRAARTTGETE